MLKGISIDGYMAGEVSSREKAYNSSVIDISAPIVLLFGQSDAHRLCSWHGNATAPNFDIFSRDL